ncbi:MAG: hypothetical protein LBI03_00350 [Clostridiales bacterium]|jgi:uncharacterized protein YlxP (DUF503 family)|nr:hypothetical protein [Clostridiales bacterium]
MSNLKKVYKKLAKKYGVSVAEIKRDMQEAIDAAYVNPTIHAQNVPSKGAIPSVDEFLEYMVKSVSESLENEKKK